MSITTQKIRATISFGNLSVSTPYILSFTVNKSRNSKSTFSTSLKVKSTDLDSLTDNKIVIKAGTSSEKNTIFTGYITNSTPSPCWDDPSYVILNLQGSDVLYRLENQYFTRRRTTRASKWAVITGVQRKADKGSQFKLVNHPVVLPTDGNLATDPQNNSKIGNITDISKTAKTVSSKASTEIPFEIKLH